MALGFCCAFVYGDRPENATFGLFSGRWGASVRPPMHLGHHELDHRPYTNLRVFRTQSLVRAVVL